MKTTVNRQIYDFLMTLGGFDPLRSEVWQQKARPNAKVRNKQEVKKRKRIATYKARRITRLYR